MHIFCFAGDISISSCTKSSRDFHWKKSANFHKDVTLVAIKVVPQHGTIKCICSESV